MKRTFALIAGAFALALSGLAFGQDQGKQTSPASLSPVQLLTRPLPPGDAQLQRGRELVIAGDCVSCHTREGGEPMAGGLGIKTPFGVIYAPNITPDRETGIGDGSADEFYRALHKGIGRGGRKLYPAFPYVYFSRVSRADSDAMLAYLKTVPAVRYTPPGNRLPFPFNLRALVHVWDLLFFRARDFQPDPAKSAEWNRGAFLVTTLGHCPQCHTPLNFLGANQNDKPFHGGFLDNWVAPDLTGNPRLGLGAWSADEIAEYLKTGRNARAQAGGAMSEVVSYSTSLMSDADRYAIATYLKDLPPSPAQAVMAADAAVLKRGAAIYTDACASCHLEGGRGQPRFFPPIPGNAVTQQRNPGTLIHLILGGGRTAPTLTRPSPLAMPSFAWKLTDQEIADVSTYVRQAWGNSAPAVTAKEVAGMRRKLGLKTSLPTANSGDRS